MIDIHTHILPGIDDGSKNVEESKKMLSMLSIQGVDTVVATPHFYSEIMNPDTFLNKRDMAAEKLKETLKDDSFERPHIALGAEVQFYNELHVMEELESFCISGTRYILIEMPFLPWTSRTYKTLEQIYANRGLVPIIAHLERYPDFKKVRQTVEALNSVGALVQVNSSFLYESFTKRKALKMLKKDMIEFLGSDAHNMDLRKPDMDKSGEILNKKLKPSKLEYLNYWENKIKEDLITF